MELDEGLARAIADLCATAGIDGLRGDLVIHKAATALAAYAGRLRVSEEDVREAVTLALAHRRRRDRLSHRSIHPRSRPLNRLKSGAAAATGARAAGTRGAGTASTERQKRQIHANLPGHSSLTCREGSGRT